MRKQADSLSADDAARDSETSEPTEAHELLDEDLAALFDDAPQDDGPEAPAPDPYPDSDLAAAETASETDALAGLAEPPAIDDLIEAPSPAQADPLDIPGDLAGDVMVIDEPEPMPRRGRTKKISRLERRRRVRLQARRVRRVVRHIEPWSVLKVSLLFYACLWVILLIAGLLVWNVADSAGTVTKSENLIKDYFVLDSFELNAREIFRGYALGGLALAMAGTAFNVLMCLLFNLISDLVGGVRITMIEEETARPNPPRRRRRRRPPPRR